MINKEENSEIEMDTDQKKQNAEILKLLRDNFGKERHSNQLEPDYQGFGLIQTFLRTKSTENGDEKPGLIEKKDLPEAKRRWKEQKKMRRVSEKEKAEKKYNPEKNYFDEPSDSHAQLGNQFSYNELIKELPRLREHFSEWLSNSNADLLPCSTSVEELENMRARIEFRLRALKIALGITQKEHDNLIIFMNTLKKY